MNWAEAEQLTRYIQGELSPDERAQLTEALLSDQDLFNAFAEEAIFAEFLRDANFRAEVNAAIHAPPSAAARIAAFLGSLGARWRWTGAVAMVVLVLLTAVILYRSRPNSAQQPIPAVLTVLLTPTERGAAAPKIAVGNYQTVRLRVNVLGGSYATYRAVLRSADGGFQREFTGMLARSDAAGARLLEMEIPGALLSVGDYSLEVFGVMQAGGAEPAAGYGFSVIPK
jgi:hypothetical protein